LVALQIIKQETSTDAIQLNERKKEKKILRKVVDDEEVGRKAP
jgi:hypothetical protein